MTRGLALLTAILATLAVALPATAAEGRTLKGVLVSVSTSAVSVKDAKNVVTTCARVAKSPSLDGFAAGDRVQAACVRARGKLVLAKIRRLAAKGDTSSNDAEPTKFGGVVTALSETSITLRDGDRRFTCSLGASSPSTGDVKVGQHLKVACSNGVLVAITKADSGKVDGPHKTVGAVGTVSAVSPTSLSVHTDGGVVTCSIGDGSPSVAGLHVGDKVKMACLDGVLKVLARSDSVSGSGDGHTGTTVAGTLTALSSSSVTVHGERGDVTCTVPATARLGDFHVGDRVGMGCLDGALVKLVKLS